MAGDGGSEMSQRKQASAATRLRTAARQVGPQFVGDGWAVGADGRGAGCCERRLRLRADQQSQQKGGGGGGGRRSPSPDSRAAAATRFSVSRAASRIAASLRQAARSRGARRNSKRSPSGRPRRRCWPPSAEATATTAALKVGLAGSFWQS